MNTQRKQLVSLIVPCFHREKTIQKDLRRIRRVMEQLRYDYEIIVVVDGMADRSYEAAKKVISSKIKVIGYKHNKGKGYAIRYGMVRAKGDIIGFIDAGMDINPNGLSLLLERLQWHNADIMIGSKRHPLSKVDYPFIRRIISLLSQIFIFVLFGLNVRDTQVGMKFFKRKVLENVMPRLLVKKFAFDIEILVVANHLGYRRIFESPVELNFNRGDSLVSKDLLRVLVKTLWDTSAVFYRLKLRHYYDDQNKRRWHYDPELNFRVNIG